MQKCIMVLGMHRSGTSAVSGVLNYMGLELGSDLMWPNDANPKGYFENNFIYRLNEKILDEFGSSWSDYRFDITKLDQSQKELYIIEAQKIIENEFRYSSNFVIKDPRICLLFPIWEEACKKLGIEIKIIIPYRNPIEVAASLKKRDDFSYEKSLILWSKHFLSANYFSKNYERLFISFDELVDNTQNTLTTLEQFTGLEISKSRKSKITKDFIDSSVKHNNISIENFTQDTPLFLQKILKIIKEKNFDYDILNEIRKDFLFSLDFFQHSELFDFIRQLKEQNSILEKIKDITTFDKEYYLNKYKDIKGSSKDPFEHFLSHGKKEGRFPNIYCELNNITSVNTILTSEMIYLKDQHVAQQNETLQQQEAEIQHKASVIASLRGQKQELESQLSNAQEVQAQAEQQMIILQEEIASHEA
ncbi:MAG: hypothetical protein PHW18_02645, partial [Sulfuricurvum sp.]|uniref:sulfotransferase family protein n=1 Tax=Sulfuricurvum sp. TaxID=2025608 RepID=UPI00262963C7